LKKRVGVLTGTKKKERMVREKRKNGTKKKNYVFGKGITREGAETKTAADGEIGETGEGATRHAKISATPVGEPTKGKGGRSGLPGRDFKKRQENGRSTSLALHGGKGRKKCTNIRAEGGG